MTTISKTQENNKQENNIKGQVSADDGSSSKNHDPNELLESIEKALSSLGRSYMKMATSLNRPVNNHLIDRSAYWILIFVGENEPLRLSDLASRLGVDVSTVSRQVKTLLDLKFLTKTCDDNDKRASLLVTTKAGQKYKDEKPTNQRTSH